MIYYSDFITDPYTRKNFLIDPLARYSLSLNPRILVAIDNSASMENKSTYFLEANCAQVAYNLATVIGDEYRTTVVSFVNDQVKEMSEIYRLRKEDISKTLLSGKTDCAVPIIWAKYNIVVDKFIIITDSNNEFVYSKLLPDALREYNYTHHQNAELLLIGINGIVPEYREYHGMHSIYPLKYDSWSKIVDFLKL
jgi:hypothetical protein